MTGVSIIIATRNRAGSLRKMLATLDRVQLPLVGAEVIVVDNGSNDETPQILADWEKAGRARQRLRVEQPGKSRALNAVIRTAQGEILAFLDDDVVVHPSYLVELWDYFATHDCAAAQGAVLWPPGTDDDPSLRPLLKRYQSCIVRADLPTDALPYSLRGANMAVRRSVFKMIGLFLDERLGPGAAGFSEDDELADRIRALGGWIGYARAAQVIHEVDNARLTEDYFRERHRRQGRSRFIYKPRGLATIMPNLVKAAFHYTLYGVLGDVRKQYYAKGRYYHYREMLNMVAQRRAASGIVR